MRLVKDGRDLWFTFSGTRYRPAKEFDALWNIVYRIPVIGQFFA
jgi:hypothetical protein